MKLIEHKSDWINENEGTTYWNFWDIMKVVLRGKFTALSVSIKKFKVHLKALTKGRGRGGGGGGGRGGGGKRSVAVNIF